MKTTILTLAMTFLIGLSSSQAWAYMKPSATGSGHMFEFNADSIIQGVLSFDKSKTRGSAADNDTTLNTDLNYAYSLENMPRIQLGGRVSYFKGAVAGRGDAEDYGVQVGIIGNHTNDLQNSYYASLYLGMDWANSYGSSTSSRRDEVLLSTIALGKRFSLQEMGIKHLTYTPEIALQNKSSTTGSSLEYSQNIQLRFLQFSVFF